MIFVPKKAECSFNNPEFNTKVSFDSYGRFSKHPNLNTKGIAVLGDSFAMGWGVNDNETIVATDTSGNHLFEVLDGGKVIFNYGPVEFPYANGRVSGSSTTTASFGRIQVPKGNYLEFLGGGAGTAEQWQIFNNNSNVFEIKSTAYGGSPITIDATGAVSYTHLTLPTKA